MVVIKLSKSTAYRVRKKKKKTITCYTNNKLILLYIVHE